MTKMTMNVVAVNHGQIDDGPYWAKVTTIGEEIVHTKQMTGQQVITFPVAADDPKKLVHQLIDKIPAEIEFQTGIRVRGGKPEMTIIAVAG